MRAELVKLYLFAFACCKTVFAQQSEYGQCGGIGWTGPTTCVSPYVCEVRNPYYHQCIAGTTTFISTTKIPTTTLISTTRLPSTTCDTSSGIRSTSSASPSPVYPSTATPMKTFFGSRWYGSALAVDHLENDSTYKKVASFNLDAATAENECKMDALEPEQNVFEFTDCDYIYDFISGLGGKFRGHNLVWDSQIPSWVNSLATSAIESAMKNHITNVIEHYAGEAYCWDVVNEPFNSDGTYASSPWYSAMGASYLEIAYSTARSVNSGAKLYLNDYNIEYPGPKSTAALNLTTVLKGLGLIDGIGFEAHYIVGEVPDSSDVAAQFAALGVEIWYTELDIRMPVPSTSDSLAQQWGDYASVTIYCARQPACVGITTWGFTDLYSWIPSTFSGYGSALPWDSTYSVKPAWTGIAENAII